MPSKSQLAAQIVAARKEAGYETRHQFAKVAGVAKSTLDLIETGQANPTIKTLKKIMNAIDYEVDVTFRPRKSKSAKGSKR